MERAKAIVKSPYTAVAFVVSAIGQVGFAWFDPLWGLLQTTSGLWFPILATTASTILPELGFDQLGTQLLVAGALLFVGVQLDKLVDRVRDYFKDS